MGIVWEAVVEMILDAALSMRMAAVAAEAFQQVLPQKLTVMGLAVPMAPVALCQDVMVASPAVPSGAVV
jgi:hypothetical protein